MLSRRSFLAATPIAIATARSSPASAANDVAPLLDLNLFDRNAAIEHARSLNGQLRYFSHEVFGDPAGIIIEDASTNGVEDADYARSGDYPAGWRMPSDLFPVNCTAKFIKHAEGRGSIRLRGADGGDFYVALGSTEHFPVRQGETLTGSISVRLADGDPSILKGVSLLIVEEGGEAASGNPVSAIAPVQQLQTDRDWWVQVQAVARSSGYATLAIKVTTAAKFDITLDLNFPQLEKRPWRSTFCAVSRAINDVSLSTSIDYLSLSERSLVITADAPRAVANATLWNEYGNDDNSIQIQLRERILYAKVVSKGTPTEIRLGVIPPLMRFSVCLVIAAEGISASLNGKRPTFAACVVPKGLTIAKLGSGANGSWNSTIGQITLFKGRVFDAEIKSRRYQAFYDDFDRADSRSIGRSPTGQMIERTGSIETAIVQRKWVADTGGLALTFAGYGKVTLANPPRYLGAVLNWTKGISGGAAGLIAATNNLLDPTDALHTLVSDREGIFQTIANSKVETALTTFIYPIAMSRDNETAYGVAFLISSREDAVVFVGPQGDLARHKDLSYAKRLGKTAVFEHYWHMSQARPEFHAVAAN